MFWICGDPGQAIHCEGKRFQGRWARDQALGNIRRPEPSGGKRRDPNTTTNSDTPPYVTRAQTATMARIDARCASAMTEAAMDARSRTTRSAAKYRRQHEDRSKV